MKLLDISRHFERVETELGLTTIYPPGCITLEELSATGKDPYGAAIQFYVDNLELDCSRQS